MKITISKLAELYLSGKDATPDLEARNIGYLWRQLVERQYNALVEQTGVKVRFVSGQPFDTAEAMLDHIANTHTLPISTDYNESELNGERGNLLFRAAHDLSHYLCDLEHKPTGRRCNFALDGETRAMARQARHLLEIYASYWHDPALKREDRARIVQIAFSEVVLQAAVFYKTGDFAEQKVVLVPVALINGWLEQNGLAPLAA